MKSLENALLGKQNEAEQTSEQHAPRPESSEKSPEQIKIQEITTNLSEIRREADERSKDTSLSKIVGKKLLQTALAGSLVLNAYADTALAKNIENAEDSSAKYEEMFDTSDIKSELQIMLDEQKAKKTLAAQEKKQKRIEFEEAKNKHQETWGDYDLTKFTPEPTESYYSHSLEPETNSVSVDFQVGEKSGISISGDTIDMNKIPQAIKEELVEIKNHPVKFVAAQLYSAIIGKVNVFNEMEEDIATKNKTSAKGGPGPAPGGLDDDPLAYY